MQIESKIANITLERSTLSVIKSVSVGAKKKKIFEKYCIVELGGLANYLWSKDYSDEQVVRRPSTGN